MLLWNGSLGRNFGSSKAISSRSSENHQYGSFECCVATEEKFKCRIVVAEALIGLKCSVLA